VLVPLGLRLRGRRLPRGHRTLVAMSDDDGERDAKAFMVLMASAVAHKRGALAIWTIYDKSEDYPDGFIARMHEVFEGGTKATSAMLKGDLEDIRKAFWKAGMMKLSRDDADEPHIVESWV
jgi:hypothetical protein